jgi:hypothetical protein
MSRTLTTLTLALALLATGCATAASPAARAQGSGIAAVAERPCLPPGVDAAFFSWTVRASHPFVVETDDDELVPVVWVLYGRGDDEIAALWSGDDLIAVDPSPRTDTPMWVDAARFDETTRVIVNGSADRCRWRRAGEQIV